MQIWCDVFATNGVKTGVGPVRNVSRFRARERMNRAGVWNATVPATDARAVDLFAAQRNALFYGIVGGAVRFLGGGAIGQQTLRTRQNLPPVLEVSGTDLLGELAWPTVGDLTLTGTGDNNVTTLLDLAPAGWNYAQTGAMGDFQARFVFETMLNAMVLLSEKTGAIFRRETDLGNIRNFRWRNTPYTTPDVTLMMNIDARAARSNPDIGVISGIEEVESSFDIIARCYAFGAGDGESRLTLAAATQWPDGTAIGSSYTDANGDLYVASLADNYIQNNTAFTDYGDRQVGRAWKEIAPIQNTDGDLEAAANFLVWTAVNWLRRKRAPVYTYRIQLAHLDAVIYPGDAVQVQARKYVDGEKPINIDRTLTVLETETLVDERGIRTVGLLASTVDAWPMSDRELISQSIRTAEIYQAHPQTGPNESTISYREHVDDDANATLNFWFGEETTTINRVFVRLRADPLRSTVKTVAGSASVNVDAVVPDHQHRTDIDDATFSVGDFWVFVRGGVSFDGLFAENIGTEYSILTGETVYLNDAQNDTIAITATVDLSSAITTTYGIFDAALAATYTPEDLEYSVNGGAWTAITSGEAISGATGWYGLDITDDVIQSSLLRRPNQANNTIALRVAAGAKGGAKKHAQITAQIERWRTVQSIAVF